MPYESPVLTIEKMRRERAQSFADKLQAAMAQPFAVLTSIEEMRKEAEKAKQAQANVDRQFANQDRAFSFTESEAKANRERQSTLDEVAKQARFREGGLRVAADAIPDFLAQHSAEPEATQLQEAQKDYRFQEPGAVEALAAEMARRKAAGDEAARKAAADAEARRRAGVSEAQGWAEIELRRKAVEAAKTKEANATTAKGAIPIGKMSPEKLMELGNDELRALSLVDKVAADSASYNTGPGYSQAHQIGRFVPGNTSKWRDIVANSAQVRQLAARQLEGGKLTDSDAANYAKMLLNPEEQTTPEFKRGLEDSRAALVMMLQSRVDSLRDARIQIPKTLAQKAQRYGVVLPLDAEYSDGWTPGSAQASGGDDDDAAIDARIKGMGAQ